MVELFLIKTTALIFLISVFVVYLCYKFRLPAVIGLLLTGIIIGPYGLKIIPMVSEVEFLAELGVIILLFTIGIESSLSDLKKMKKEALLGGSLQIIGTVLISFLAATRFGFSATQAVFIGFLFSLSSTAVVMKLLSERNEHNTPHGRSALAILIFQDMIVILMILLIPALSGQETEIIKSLGELLIKGIAIIILTLILAYYIVPKVFHAVGKTRMNELFLLTIVLLCFTITWLTASAGLSLALGAFLAGLIISESEYSHQALANLLPLRDLLTSFFFVSIGMLLNFRIFFDNGLTVILVALAVIAFKTILTSIILLQIGLPLRTSLLAGFSISQIGEFSFVLLQQGLSYNILPETSYQTFLAISILTIIVTPLIFRISPKIAYTATRIKYLNKYEFSRNEEQKEALKNHLIIIGFGKTGRDLAATAKETGIKYQIIEMNLETVRKEQAKEPIIFGDATHKEILNHVFAANAKTIIVAINDPTATARIVKACREINDKAHIVARAQFIGEISKLKKFGADEIISEELETSIQICRRVMSYHKVPRATSKRILKELKSQEFAKK